MKIFFDTEFTGLHKDTSLISIGLVAENGEEFYAELIDYDKSQIDEWIQKNVIDNLIMNEEKQKLDSEAHGSEGISVQKIGVQKRENNLLKCVSTKSGIKLFLKKWLEQFDTVEWISDVCHYDFVLLIDLVYGHALKMPYGKHNAACHDINQDIANHYKISEIKAFDKSREDILNENGIVIQGEKHNALYDAKVIKEIYKICL